MCLSRKNCLPYTHVKQCSSVATLSGNAPFQQLSARNAMGAKCAGGAARSVDCAAAERAAPNDNAAMTRAPTGAANAWIFEVMPNGARR